MVFGLFPSLFVFSLQPFRTFLGFKIRDGVNKKHWNAGSWKAENKDAKMSQKTTQENNEAD